MASTVDAESGTWWSYRQEDNVGIWNIDDWERLFEEEIGAAEQHFQKTAADPGVTAALVVFDKVGTLDAEMQDHITDSWSQLGQSVDLERSGYVADGITAMAVRSNVRDPDTEIDSFESEQRALEWAKDA